MLTAEEFGFRFTEVKMTKISLGSKASYVSFRVPFAQSWKI